MVLTLPCNREAAIASLKAAIVSAKKAVILQAVTTIVLVAVFAIVLTQFNQMAPVFPRFTSMFIVVFMLFALLIPVMSYLQLKPWIAYLEELVDGLRTGRTKVEDVCGVPITFGHRGSLMGN